MKANELRIGNWILFNNFIQPKKFVQVDARFFCSFGGGRPLNELKNDDELNDYYRPIPLTPEILEKAGFEKYEWMDGYFKKTKFGDLMVQFCKGGIYTYFTNIGSDGQGMKMRGRKWVGNLNSTQNIIHLHQLQNLYFALTGEELSITL